MNRIDELTIRLVEDELSADEQTELDALLTEPAHRRRHLGLLEVEAALASLRDCPPVAAETVARVQRESSRVLEQSVMRAIAVLPDSESEDSALREKPGLFHRAGALMLGAALLTVCVLLAVLSSGWWVSPPYQERSRFLAKELAKETAVLVERSADVRLVSADGKTTIPPIGTPLLRGRTLSTLHDGWAVVQFADGTRLNLYAESRLKVETTRDGGKQIGLLTGSLRADVKTQPKSHPLVITTPHTSLRIAGTRVTLASLTDQGTRVDLDEGAAELLQEDGPPMPLTAGSIAFVPANRHPVVVKLRSWALTKPRREISFRGLRRLSSLAEGEPVLGATAWQAVFWHGDDRVEAVPVSQQGRRGTRIEHVAGPQVVFRDRNENRWVFWNARRRAVWKERPMKDRHEEIGAIPPTGEWVALIDHRKVKRKSFRLVHWGMSKTVRFDGRQIISAMAASPDGRWLAVGRRRIGHSTGNAVDLIDCRTARRVARLDVQFSHPIALAFSADGKRLAVGLTGRMQVWDVEAHQRVCMIDQPGCPIIHIALSPNGKTLAGTSQGDRVWVWDVATKAERFMILPGEQTRGLQFSPDADRLILLTKSGRISEWTIPPKKPQKAPEPNLL